MPADFYKLGAESAWSQYLVNPAKRVGTALFSNIRQDPNAGTLKNIGTGVLDFARESVFGSPINVYKDVRRLGTQSGKFNLGRGVSGLYREAFAPTAMPATSSAGKMLSQASRALPAAMAGAQLYSAIKNPEDRARNVGGAVANIAMSPLTSRLGVPGMILSAPVTAAGRAIGGLFAKKRPPVAQPPSDYMEQYYQALRNGAIRGHMRAIDPATPTG